MEQVQTNGVFPGLTSQTRPSRFLTLSRWITVLVFAGATACCVAFSLHWRMAVDTPVMHYVVFLLHHGLKPYSDITDNNMPGAYLTEAAAMAVFGWSDLAWRLYEFFLFAVLAVSAVVITRRRDPVAGIFATGTFLVLHIAEGPQLSVERELVIGVALMAGCAALLESLRQCRPSLTLIFGLLAGVAASIKPTYLPLPLGLLAIASVALRRKGKKPLPYLLWSLLGLVLVGLVVLAFLLYEHAIPGFLFILTKVIPTYTGLERPSLGFLLDRMMPHVLVPLVLLTIPLAVANLPKTGRWTSEQWIPASAAAFGLLSYFAQGKGFLYHRYVFLMFLLLLIGEEMFVALGRAGWPRIVAATALGFTLVYLVPTHLRTTRDIVGRSDFELTLEQDLAHMGAAENLQGRVQCFDLVYGCLNALYHRDLMENTGFTGDMLLFTAQGSAVGEYYRQLFWTFARRDPAEVIVVSNGNFGVENSFGKLARWPQFSAYLQQNYTETAERCFAHERYGVHYPGALPPGDCYRIYLHNGSPLLSVRAPSSQ